ncbi:MAG: type II toxin-antitoxin system RelE/ParE family toxin [Acidiferrobacteraceae bacterium]
MLKSFRSKALAELWSTGSTRKIDRRLHERILRRLDRSDAATMVEEMDVPGFDFHPLHGRPQRYSVHVNGPWCLTFEFTGGDALRMDLEQYH